MKVKIGVRIEKNCMTQEAIVHQGVEQERCHREGCQTEGVITHEISSTGRCLSPKKDVSRKDITQAECQISRTSNKKILKGMQDFIQEDCNTAKQRERGKRERKRKRLLREREGERGQRKTEG